MAFINCPECNESISEKAKVCVHCGYPLVEEKPAKIEFPKAPNYELVSTEDPRHPVATLLKIAAVLTLVVGLVAGIAIDVANEMFGVTLAFLLVFGFGAYITWQISDLVNKIQNTHEMLRTLELTEHVEKKAGTQSAQSGYKLSAVASGVSSKNKKECAKCGRMNAADSAICQDCGASLK